MLLDKLVQTYNDLTKLDPSAPSVVQYHPGKGLVFRQLGKVIGITTLNTLFFPKPKLKLGVLTPEGYSSLMDSLKKLIEDPELSKGGLSTMIRPYGFDVYKCYVGSVEGPQLYVRVRFVTFTNVLISKLVLYTFNPETKTLLKALNNELKSN